MRSPRSRTLVREHDLWDRVLVGSFSPARIREFRRLTDGRVPTAAHPWEILAFRFLPSAWLADRIAGTGLRGVPGPAPPGTACGVVTPGLVRRAHAAGKQVHVWTVDEPDEMRVLLDRGVDGLFTDRTDLLKDVLARRGVQWQ